MGLQKTFIALAIAVVFATFVSYGLSVIYEQPKYDFSENDCNIKYDCYKPMRECEAEFMQNKTSSDGPMMVPGPNDCYTVLQKDPAYKECIINSDICNEEFTKNSPQYSHARNTFFILLFLGLIAIVGGGMFLKQESIGSGFIGGGVIIILWSLVRSGVYVYHLDKYMKLAGLGLVLATLVYMAYKKLDAK